MKTRYLLALLAVPAACSRPVQEAQVAPSTAARARPLPYPVFETRGFQSAVAGGTRTRTGAPGASYWQQSASYRLEASLDPAANRLSGRGTVRYTNNSPDTLRFVAFHLHQNLFREDALRNRVVPITGGMTLDRVAVGGEEAREISPGPQPQGAPAPSGPVYVVSGTILRVRTPQPVLPGAAVDLEFAWHFAVTPDGAPRGGQDGQVWFLSYWYPQAAVYDDVNGWQTDAYMANSEFYMGYGDYEVALTVPEGWLIGATGTLTNPSEVLSPPTRDRLAAARSGREVTHVVEESGRGAGDDRATQRGANGTLTWRFSARNVRDFAWGTSDRYLWDATIAEVGDADGDGRPDTSMAYTFRRPEKRGWVNGNQDLQYSVEFLSRFLWPYPYPVMTSIDGPRSCGGMEYPAITCIGGGATGSVFGVTLHETAHMWFPMMVGSDEKRFAWQDEGITSFNTDQGAWDRSTEGRRGANAGSGSRRGYLSFAASGQEVELMRWGDLYPPTTAAYGVASYPKMATNMWSLRSLLGDSLFLRAYREYGRRWLYRHPTPYDFFNTFNDVAGRDLSWFWRTWWYETWTLDQAIGAVEEQGTELVVAIEDRGLAPMPVRLAITRRDGSVERREVPVEVWLSGASRTTVRLPRGGDVVRLEIDPEEAFPDADRGNQRWTRPAGGN